MKMRNFACFIVAVVLACMASIPSAHADDWNQKTELSFSQPIEIPGTVLPAGSYWFVLYDSPSADHDIVRVYSSDWSKEYAILLTIPAYRRQSSDATEIKFAERPHDKPDALLTWYYPGRLTGHEFLYSSRHENEFARDSKRDLEIKMQP